MSGLSQNTVLSGLDLSQLVFRWVSATEVDDCFSIEKSSYPEDEAATLSSLRYRQENAGSYFLGAYLSSGQMLGFVCGTLCKKFDHDTMTEHDGMGHILAIHSVVVTAKARRNGVAKAMLRRYIDIITYESEYLHVLQVMLICKQDLLRFYIGCGFTVTGLSSISHGSTPWIECEMDLVKRRKPKFWVVDAFTGIAGKGNPAAVVVPVRNSLYENKQWSQTVAAEFNLSETVFVSERKIKGKDDEEAKHFDLKYFSPTVEIEFCGHATLAAAHVLFTENYADKEKQIVFHISSMSPLIATMSANKIVLDFPLQPPRLIDNLDRLKGLEIWIEESVGVPRKDIIAICDTEINDLLVEIDRDAFNSINPDFSAMKSGEVGRGIIIACAGDVRNNRLSGTSTAAAQLADFSSRFFAPGVGIDEDPVTGSAHCTLAPYFAEKLGKTSLFAWQDSKRGGSMLIDVVKERRRVFITAAAVIASQGVLLL